MDRQAATDCGGWRAGHNGGDQPGTGCNRDYRRGQSGPKTMLDNEFLNENNVLLRATSVAERGSLGVRPSFNRSKPVRNPKPFTVFQPIPGQNPKPLFVIHAYSLEQARALVAAKVAGATIIVGPVSLDGASQ
jgi:hypothetical protein